MNIVLNFINILLFHNFGKNHSNVVNYNVKAYVYLIFLLIFNPPTDLPI